MNEIICVTSACRMRRHDEWNGLDGAFNAFVCWVRPSYNTVVPPEHAEMREKDGRATQ